MFEKPADAKLKPYRYVLVGHLHGDALVVVTVVCCAPTLATIASVFHAEGDPDNARQVHVQHNCQKEEHLTVTLHRRNEVLDSQLFCANGTPALNPQTTT